MYNSSPIYDIEFILKKLNIEAIYKYPKNVFDETNNFLKLRIQNLFKTLYNYTLKNNEHISKVFSDFCEVSNLDITRTYNCLTKQQKIIIKQDFIDRNMVNEENVKCLI